MIKKIFKLITKLSVLELVKLVKIIETKFNIKDFKDIQKKKKQHKYNIYISKIIGNKISIIKEVKNITGLSLIESKKKIDNLPFLVKENIDKKEIEDIKNKFNKLNVEYRIDENTTN